MRPLIGFLLKTYPKLSETFILNEILELERQGLNLHLFSLRRPPEQPTHPGVAQVKAPVTYLPSLLPEFNPVQEKQLIDAQLDLFHRDSSTYLKTLQFYLSRHEERRLHEFLQGCYLAWQLQKLGINHLHVHFANVPTATAEIAHMLTGIPYSITAHAKDIYLSDRAALDRRMTKAEFILTCTDFNRRYLEEISTASTPIYLAYHGLDISRFSPAPRTQQSEIPLILSVGRFCEKKGFPYLLQACYLLKQMDLPFRCAIVGYGPLEDALGQQISELGLNDQITLVGKLTQDQLIEYYQQADLFVLPCLVTDDGDRDGIPNVLLEAMAMEVPVVSTQISGIAELVQSNHNGMLVPEKDALALAQTLEPLLRQPELRTTLGKAGRCTVLEKFGLTRNVGAVKDWLLQAVKSPMSPQTQASMLSDLLKMAAF
ncbi:group 1 glycosyl transferase [Leptolyngbya sp. Heron Island J]|uniref:glycosyltransferase n=1 Tax=Leptolyngbya sp. Heron Island J TaxID=1385935 RepID=UPI0003B9EFCF|nr:glycosyltransferase [Leptolyngbya sp. Heron Island J]ESA34000.1 group 1 glycosyl transferase [Leptolyngbya sp. Heron Island J]